MNVLQNKVLVLNKGWHPIAIVSLERAMRLVSDDYAKDDPKARIIDPTQDFRLFTWKDWSLLKAAEGEAVIRGARNAHRIPEIIVLSRYNKFPHKIAKMNRRTIYHRDGNQCQYCGEKPKLSELSIDHLIARSRGGKTTWENCVLACTNCNRRKGAKTMQEARMTFFHPGYKPTKPKVTLFSGEKICKSWRALIDEIYWNTELDNDNTN